MPHPTHDHRECIKLFEKLSEYIDGEADHVTCEIIQTHMKDCACCSACMETLKRTVGFCEKSEDLPVPESFSKRLRQAIEGLLPK